MITFHDGWIDHIVLPKRSQESWHDCTAVIWRRRHTWIRMEKTSMIGSRCSWWSLLARWLNLLALQIGFWAARDNSGSRPFSSVLHLEVASRHFMLSGSATLVQIDVNRVRNVGWRSYHQLLLSLGYRIIIKAPEMVAFSCVWSGGLARLLAVLALSTLFKQTVARPCCAVSLA